jgi:hypothetical protein
MVWGFVRHIRLLVLTPYIYVGFSDLAPTNAPSRKPCSGFFGWKPEGGEFGVSEGFLSLPLFLPPRGLKKIKIL